MKKTTTNYAALWRLYKGAVYAVSLLFYLGGIGLLIYIATFMPQIKSIANQVGGVFFSMEMTARDIGVTTPDLMRMVVPRSTESGTKFATAMRDFVVDGAQLAQTANERNIVDIVDPLNRLLRKLRPEQIQLVGSVLEKQILNGNVDRIFDFAAQDAQSSIVGKISDALDGDFMRGMNVIGAWLQQNDTLAMMDELSAAPVGDMVRNAAAMMDEMERSHAVSTLTKLTNVLVKVTDALEKAG